MPGMHLWNPHPRAYLPIEPAGEAKRPCCGACYVLEGERPPARGIRTG